MKTPISPCCKSEMYLSARMDGMALYKCSECKEYKLPIGYKPYHKPKRMNEQEKATKILFYLLAFTISIFALSVLALAYVYVHPTITL